MRQTGEVYYLLPASFRFCSSVLGCATSKLLGVNISSDVIAMCGFLLWKDVQGHGYLCKQIIWNEYAVGIVGHLFSNSVYTGSSDLSGKVYLIYDFQS